MSSLNTKAWLGLVFLALAMETVRYNGYIIIRTVRRRQSPDSRTRSDRLAMPQKGGTSNE